MAENENEATKGTEEEQTEGTPTTEAPPAPAQMLPPGVMQLDLSEKDIEKLAQLEGIEQRFNAGCGALIKGIAKMMGEAGQIDQLKSQLANELKIKHELPEDVIWEANFKTGKLYFKKNEVPTPPAPPAGQ